MKQVRFEESEVPYQTLAHFGLTHEKIEDLPLWALEDIGQGRRSPLLPIRVRKLGCNSAKLKRAWLCSRWHEFSGD